MSPLIRLMDAGRLGTNLKIPNLELPEPQESRTSNILNLSSPSKTKPQTSQTAQKNTNLEPNQRFLLHKMFEFQITLSGRNPTIGTSWDQLEPVRTSQDQLEPVGNQRNYRILTLKKRLRKKERRRRKKKNIGYRVASNERRLKNKKICNRAQYMKEEKTKK